VTSDELEALEGLVSEANGLITNIGSVQSAIEEIECAPRVWISHSRIGSNDDYRLVAPRGYTDFDADVLAAILQLLRNRKAALEEQFAQLGKDGAK
jgi:anaerobic glycerol-3-phosphate dehydrogenase